MFEDRTVNGPSRCSQSPSVIAVECLAAATAIVVLYCIDPADGGTYPVCLFHQFTGLHCPGCGSLRAMHQLLHGHLAAALAMNPLAVCTLPLLIAAGLWNFLPMRFRPARSLPHRRLLPFHWMWLVVIVVIAFGILRNVPAYPFTLLAPH
jgi:Protein of unknown function (DUF2752)